MNVNEMTYGVEIECTVPIRSRIRAGGYHRGNQVRGLPDGWVAQSDCSIHCGAGHKPVEITSPILRGADGLRQIIAVCSKLNAWGAKVNHSCGVHVHVGWGSDLHAALPRLTAIVANHEKGIYASTGTHAREQGSYCAPIRERYRQLEIGNGSRSCRYGGLSRYHLLNVTNTLYDARPTVEFRAFSGSTNAQKIIAWVRLCLGLCERALSDMRRAKWDPKTPSGRSPMLRKSGEGLTELTRLLYALGWVKGRIHNTFGEVVADDLPAVEESKKQLRALARKYDKRVED